MVIQDKVIILTDDSESMNIQLNEKKKSEYYQQISEKLTKSIKSKELEYENHNLSDYNELKKKSSFILPFLEFINKKNTHQNIKAVYLLSDGWIHDENLQILSSLNIPIYTFNPNIEENIEDIKIDDTRYNKIAYQSETALFSVRISSLNTKKPVKVQFLSGNKLIQEKQILTKENQSIDVDFEIQFNKTGLIPFTILILGKDDYPQNNSFAGAVQVLESKQKIAIISDILNYDVLYLSQLLRQNKRYSIDVITQKNRQFYQNGKNHKLITSDYSSLIMVNNGSIYINPETKNEILKQMEQTFGLLLIGHPINGLNEISPVSYSNISNLYRGNFKISPSAFQYKIFEDMNTNIQDIPLISYLYLTPKNQGQILSFIENESKSPWIVYRSYLNSHIFQICGFDLWKWKSLNGESGYNDFFNGLVDWISRKNNERFYAYTDKNSYLFGEPVTLKLNAYDESFNPLLNISPKITIQKDGQAFKEDFLSNSDNQFQIKLDQLKPGNYNFEVSDKSKNLSSKGQFIIHEKDRELYETGINKSMLSMISNLSKGQFIQTEELNHILQKPQKENVIQQKEEVQIYKKWQMILLFILLISGEYFLRKRWGLL